MARILNSIITVLERTASGSSAAPLKTSLRERLRKDPQLIDDLEFLFTADQLASLMGDSPEEEADE
jgi:hypothetical protein